MARYEAEFMRLLLLAVGLVTVACAAATAPAPRTGPQPSPRGASPLAVAPIDPTATPPDRPAVLPKPYEQTFGPDFPAQPPSGDRTRVEDASISADGRTLTLAFTGGVAYTPNDFCATDYTAWAAVDGADLEVAVTAVTHRDQATAPPNGACADVGHGYTFHVLLQKPFTGSTVRDLAGGILWVRAPTGLVEPHFLPAGWQVGWSGDEPAAEPPLWVRVYAPAGSHVTGDNGGRGQLDLYQAFGAATQIGGGEERSAVKVGAADGVLLRQRDAGEMLLQWMVRADGVALVGNDADMSLDELLAIARSVQPAG